MKVFLAILALKYSFVLRLSMVPIRVGFAIVLLLSVNSFLSCMTDFTYNVVTVNVNRLSSQARLMAFKQFLTLNNIHICAIQESVITDYSLLSNYHYVSQPNDRGSEVGFLYRKDLDFQVRCYSTSPYLIVGCLQNVSFINIYGLSGSINKQAREQFLLGELHTVLHHISTPYIVLGDFNAVTGPADVTGPCHPSQGLLRLIHTFSLVDTWRTKHPGIPGYTYYYHQGD